MKKSFFIFSAAVFILTVFCGCATVADDFELAQRELKKEISMGERVITAFQKSDFGKFRQDMPAEVRAVWGQKEFEFECKNLEKRWGDIDSYRYLTRLEMEPVHQHVWAVRFKRRNMQNQWIYQEVLFVILTGKVDGQAKIFLFAFK